MAVDFSNLTVERLEAMGDRETIRGLPETGYTTPASITKKQLATLIKIDRSGTRGFGQIRDYNDRSYETGKLPSSSVAYTLEDKGLVRVGRRRQVSRRTGRGRTGFETQTEGGYVNTLGATGDLLDAIARKLGYSGRLDDRFGELADRMLR